MNTKAEKMVTTPELLSNDDVFGSMVRLSQDNMHTYDIDYDNFDCPSGIRYSSLSSLHVFTNK